MTPDNRGRLIALVAACTKLEQAASLVKEAATLLASTALTPYKPLQKIEQSLSGCVMRIDLLIKRIP